VVPGVHPVFTCYSPDSWTIALAGGQDFCGGCEIGTCKSIAEAGGAGTGKARTVTV
jgi:hypothetical protein